MSIIAMAPAIARSDSGQKFQSADLEYRADIDGLRAIAVLPVVMFHAFPSVLSGGFIGVDVFFVISGFLISSIMLKELAQERFSYRTFYARRIRRLVPSLALVLTASVAAGWVALFPHEFASLGRNVAGAAAFVSNFVLYRQSGYFDSAAEAKPLLHLWSLGIEEQFYLVWPLLLATITPRPRGALLSCILMLAVSFALNVYVTRTNASEAFYMPFTRWWELMTGAILGWFTVFGAPAFLYGSVDRFLLAPNWIAREIGAAAGLSLILGGTIGMHNSIEFPGWWALVPVSGANLLIASKGAWLNRKVLASTPLVAIGIISYPLYLWHWPLLAFARASAPSGEPSAFVIAGLVAVSFVLAALTYLGIEKPIRFGKWRKTAARPLCAVLMVVGISGIAISYNEGFPKRISDGLRAVIAGELIPKPYSYHDWRIETCFIDDSKSNWKFAGECYGDGRRPLVMLWGSSTAASIYPALVGALNRVGYGLAQFTAVDCGPTLDSAASDDNQHCRDVNKFVVGKVVPMLKPDIIIMHTVWREEETIRYMDETIQALRKVGASRIVVIGPEPWWDRRNGLPEVYVDYARKNPNRPLLPERTTFGLWPRNEFEDKATRVKAMALQLQYISIWDALCNQQGCLTRVGNSLRQDMTTYDRAHLTPKSWSFLMPSIMGQLLKKPVLH